MILYCVDIPPYDDHADGEDNSEWFSSEESARRRAALWKQKIRSQPSDFRFTAVSVRRFVIPRLPSRKLALMLLNRLEPRAFEYVERWDLGKEKKP